jgi:hypothetical protein
MSSGLRGSGLRLSRLQLQSKMQKDAPPPPVRSKI